jgi:predicted dehydrogenase
MEFADGTATFTASTKIEGNQYMEASGENGSVFIPVPFSPLADTATKMIIKRDQQHEEIELAPCDHYRNMADAFAESVFSQQPVPTPLSDALANMKIIDAIFASAAKQSWVNLD